MLAWCVVPSREAASRGQPPTSVRPTRAAGTLTTWLVQLGWWLVSCLGSSQAKALDACEDLVGGLDPDEGLGVFVVGLEERPDGRLQGASAAMSAAAELLLGQLCEPPFDLVDPGGVGGREVEMEARMAQQPVTDERGLV